MPPKLQAYVRLFNAGRFFEAHEVLEELWWESDCHPFWQGLIIFAAAYEKARQGSRQGARKHFEAAVRYLTPFLPRRAGVDVAAVIAHAQRCAEMLAAGMPTRALPPWQMVLRPAPEGEAAPPEGEALATDDEIRRVAEDVVAGGRSAPSVLKEVLLRLGGRAGRSRAEPIVREVLARFGGSHGR